MVDASALQADLGRPSGDGTLARTLAVEAGQLLVELRSEIDRGVHPERVKMLGDVQAHRFLAARLAELRPEDAVLSEEGYDNPERLRNERVWIVDPLDGTREFGQPPRIDWAVHVALCVDGDPVDGAVSLPDENLVFATDAPPTVPPRTSDRIRMAVSRSRPAWPVFWAADHLDAEMIPMGSAGAKAMAVVRGDVDVYLHAGGQYEWDNAAPAVVALSAGLHASRMDGSPLRYNRPDPWLPDLLICRPELADSILSLF